MKITKSLYTSAVIATTIASMAIAMPAFAESDDNRPNMMGRQNTNNSQNWQGRGQGMMNRQGPALFGVVIAINGNTLTVTGKGFDRATSTASTTYTVDASTAKIYKNNATSTVSGIAVNDRVSIQGTVSGTNIKATVIHDGALMLGRKSGDSEDRNKPDLFNGNGQPVVAGTVSSINGATINITTKSNTTYTINAASSTVRKAGATSTVSSIVTGDFIVVQGVVNGNSVTASTIIDQAQKANINNGRNNPKAEDRNVFSSVGKFFKNLFGF